MSFNKTRDTLIESCEPDCPERAPGCHGTCKRYKRAKEVYKRKKAALHSEVDQYVSGKNAYIRDICAKARRK